MSDIKWNKAYEIDHHQIDFEHQIFIELVAKLDDAAKNNKPHEYIQRLLEELHKYADFHFISEENIMYEIDYPDMANHQKLHQQLLEKFNQMALQIRLNKLTVEDFVEFLKQWFLHHTVEVDLKISDYIKNSKK